MFKLKGRKGSNNLGMVRKGEIKRKEKGKRSGNRILVCLEERKREKGNGTERIREMERRAVLV